ncbi:MAG: membrane protein insertion efficiency factor YidD [Actinobacteria bacterium]|nr:membrane protein insertion efficiency factor YidD [Actinomycetota bacterium]
MKSVLIRIIKFYQRYLSPLKGRTCRFHPTCSEYAIQAIDKHGLAKGSLLSFKRVMRCHPFNPGGYDPVP